MISQCKIPEEIEKQIQIDLQSPIEFISGGDFENPEKASHFLHPAAGLEWIAQNGYQSQFADSTPSGTPDAFSCLYAAELLTVEQEHHLFRKMNYLKYLAEQIRKEILEQSSNGQHELYQQLQGKLHFALSIRNYIITANLRLVVSIAKKMVDANNSLEDLFAQGNVPLVRAVEIFDFERGTRFSTYATWAVRNHLYRITKKNRRHHQNFVTGDTGFFEGCSDTRSSKADSETAQLHFFGMLDSVIDKLPERDQLIVSERFGLFDTASSPRTFREIGLSLGISTERVRQLLHRSLEKLQGYLEEHDFELRV